MQFRCTFHFFGHCSVDWRQEVVLKLFVDAALWDCKFVDFLQEFGLGFQRLDFADVENRFEITVGVLGLFTSFNLGCLLQSYRRFILSISDLYVTNRFLLLFWRDTNLQRLLLIPPRSIKHSPHCSWTWKVVDHICVGKSKFMEWQFIQLDWLLFHSVLLYLTASVTSSQIEQSRCFSCNTQFLC